MAAGTKVQLRLGERVVAEVSFREDALRIGRMKENDLVINNLAVSRFHAVLRRLGDGYEVEDLGSENGTFVDGVQVKGKVALPSDAEITIGKHVLSIRSGNESAPAPRARKSDAWDAAQTYFAPELAQRAQGPAEAPAPAAPAGDDASDEQVVVAEALEDTGGGKAAPAEEAFPLRTPAASHDLPDPDGLFAFGEDELHAPAQAPAAEAAPELGAEFDVAAPEPVAPAAPVPASAPAPAAPAGPARPEAGSETLLFDFGATDDLGLSEPSLMRAAAAKKAAAAAEPAAPPPAAASPLHAGFIVERGGKVERVAPFARAELIVGRGPTCDLVLATVGVSRRHARFVREGDGCRVQDLGSANGVQVNGERVTERPLQVGDVVTIDDFTLTFVVDREPLDGVVRSAPAPKTGDGRVTVLHDAPLATMLEQDLLLDGDDDGGPLDGDKELESVAEMTGVADAQALEGVDAEWVVECVISPEQLPPAVRDALRELGGEVRLPGELRLRRRG